MTDKKIFLVKCSKWGQQTILAEDVSSEPDNWKSVELTPDEVEWLKFGLEVTKKEIKNKVIENLLKKLNEVT